jgi:hypothetical protein
LRLAPFLAPLLLAALPASAATIVLDFAEEPLGDRGDSFVSAECGCVRFSEWTGGELRIATVDGAPVLVVGEQGGTLLIDFLSPVVSARLEFGGDSSDPDVETRPAVFVGLSGGEFAGIASTVANRNGAIDQTLQIAAPPNLGPPIDQALFSFVQLGENMPESPLVGRLTIVTAPEPAAGLLLLPALAACARARRKEA